MDLFDAVPHPGSGGAVTVADIIGASATGRNVLQAANQAALLALVGADTPTDRDAAITALIAAAPSALNTLKELADALGDDPNFATTMATALGNRLRVDAAQGLTAIQQAQAIANIGSAKHVTPEQYGTVGTANDTSVFQAAVDDLTTHGGGTLWLTKTTYNVGGLVQKSNVAIRSATRSSIAAPSGYGGWIIDTPATPKQFNMGLYDLNVLGGVTSGASPATGGIRYQLAAACQVHRVGVSGTSLGCFRQVLGQATQLIGCGFLNLYQFRTLTVPEGALWLGGTDHLVIGCECNGGDFTTVQYPGTLYRCGMLIAGGTMWIYGSNGEYSDVGIRVTGTTNRFIGARGDVNAGHGIMVNNPTNHFTNTLVGSNSLASPGDYDGIYLDSGAYGTVLDGVMEFPDFTGAGVVHRHVVNDQVDIFTDAKSAPQLPIIRDVVDSRSYKYRKINQLYPYRSIEQPTIGNPAGARPPARYAAGATFYDTINNKPTYSDGTSWRDTGGDIVSNLLTPRTSNMNDPAEIGWTTLSGSGSTTSALGGNGWTKFARARMLEITAGGAATSCGAQMKVPSRVTGVKVGASYTVMLYHLGVTQLASLAVIVLWYDSGGTLIGSPVTLASDTQLAVNAAQLYRATGIVAPAGAVQANLQVIFTRTGMASGEKYQITKVCLVPGAPTDYVEP